MIISQRINGSWAVVGLMDRALDLKPEVTQGCGFESRLRQEVHDCSPGAAQSAAHCSKCTHLDGLNAEILCIIVYVTNKAHPSLISMEEEMELVIIEHERTKK